MPSLKASKVSWLAALILAPIASADVIISATAGAAFQPMVGPTAVGLSPRISGPDQAPKPYWDQKSLDAGGASAGCNIGWVVTGGSLAGCSNVRGPIPFTKDDPVPNSYWAQPNGNYDPFFYFLSTAGDATELELTVTSLPGDEIGWFTLTNNAIVRHSLGRGSGDVPEKLAATIGAGEFGFYLSNGTDTFYTDSRFNTRDAGIQHFAVFRNSPSGGTNDVTNYYIGAEDAPAGTDFDYQDVIIHVAPLATGGAEGGGEGGGCGGGGGCPIFAGDIPEPGTLGLMGLAALALTVRGLIGRSRA